MRLLSTIAKKLSWERGVLGISETKKKKKSKATKQKLEQPFDSTETTTALLHHTCSLFSPSPLSSTVALGFNPQKSTAVCVNVRFAAAFKIFLDFPTGWRMLPLNRVFLISGRSLNFEPIGPDLLDQILSSPNSHSDPTNSIVSPSNIRGLSHLWVQMGPILEDVHVTFCSPIEFKVVINY